MFYRLEFQTSLIVLHSCNVWFYIVRERGAIFYKREIDIVHGHNRCVY